MANSQIGIGDVVDIDSAKVYLADRDARSFENWETQDDTNKRTNRWVRDHEKRITSLEKKVIWLTFLGATMGGSAGQLLPKLMNALGGG